MFWLTLILTVSFLLSGIVINFSPANDDCDFDAARASIASLSLARRVGFWLMILAVSPLIILMIAGCWLKIVFYEVPICFFDALRDSMRLKRYQDPVFEPATFFDLPESVRGWLDATAFEFFAANFSMVGLFETQPSPMRCVRRAWISDNGLMLAEQLWFRDRMEWCVESIFSDGSCLSSNTISAEARANMCPISFDDAGSHQQILHVDLTLAELIAEHQREVAMRCQRRGCQVMLLSSDDYRSAALYSARVLGQLLFEVGQRKPAPPPAGEVPGTKTDPADVLNLATKAGRRED